MPASSTPKPAAGARALGQAMYGLSPQRIEKLEADASALESTVIRLASTLAFEAEPWGFGQTLRRIAHPDDQKR